MKKFANVFVAGITAVLPISLTIYILYKVFIFIDGLTASIMASLIGKKIIGIGFVTTILIIFFVGLFAKHYFGKKIILLTEFIVKRIPVAQTIYNAIKEISNSIFSKDKNSFQTPVLVKYPNKEFKSLGFITNENILINNESKIAVFIPTTPNPTSGFLVFVNIEDIEIVDISIDEAMKAIISLGVISPREMNTKG